MSHNKASTLSIGLSQWPYGTIKGQVSLADHSLALQSMHQLMDGNQGTLVGVILQVVHHYAVQYLVFFEPQHNTAYWDPQQNGPPRDQARQTAV